MKTYSWTHYRWNEGSAVIENHPDQTEEVFLYVSAVSRRLADFNWRTWAFSIAHN